MSFNKINNQEIPILVIYYTKSRIIYKTEFGSFSKFGLLLDFFNSKIASDSIKLKKKYLLNDKEINNDDLLINLIQGYAISKRIINATFSIELNEFNNIGDEDIPLYKKIIQPKLDTFGLYIFIPETCSLSLEEYPEKIMKYFKFKKINKFSAYCNSHDSLYISGGIYNEENIKDFWIINNRNFQIEKKLIPFPKSNHSMIYIEFNNNQFIFFIGGNNSFSFYYDIKNKNFASWGDICASYIRPSLIQIEEYLYCFNFTLDENNEIFFEKTKLNSAEHNWEKVYPKFEKKEMKSIFLNNNFSISKCAGKKIIFIGGKNGMSNNENVFLYDINMNSFYANIICNNQFIDSIDKSFYKVNNSHNIILPDFSNEQGTYEIGILNKIKYTFRKIKLNPCEEKHINLIKYKNIREENSNVGKVIVHFKTEESENNINKNVKNENNMEEYTYNLDSNNLNSEKNIPIMINSMHINNQKEENEIENVEPKLNNNQKENIEEEETNIIKNNINENKDIKENDNNGEYIIYDNSEIDNVDKKFNEENELENSLNGENVNLDNNNEEEEENMNENQNENENEEEFENYEEEEYIERDKFELTITQPLGEDIIQIENYPMSRYDPDNFCDYQTK